MVPTKGETMADFATALALTLIHEGGYTNNPNDRGGETNRGITLHIFQQSAQSLLGIPPTSSNLRALTQPQAAILYRSLFWNPILGDQLPNQPLANLLFDSIVNSGRPAITQLQNTLNSFNPQPPVTPDGNFGPATLVALLQSPPNDLYNRYKQTRIHFYESLGQLHPDFIQGWLNRINSYPNQ
jgi:lysozyme family protein